MAESRREAIRLAIGGAGAWAFAGAQAPVGAKPAANGINRTAKPHWRTGTEGRRTADLGNDTYRNPVLPGDWPDPTILKDGDDYYLTHSAFDATPGLLIWHSRDLVNWTPLCTALAKPLGTVFACDLVKHGGRY